MTVMQHDIRQPHMALSCLAIDLARALHIRRIEMALVVRIVTVTAINRRRQTVANIAFDPQMRIEMHRLVVFLNIQQTHRMAYLARVRIAAITARSIAFIRKSGIECRGRIERLLHVVQVLVVSQRAEQTQIERQPFGQHVLRHIHFGGQIASPHLADDTVVLAETDRAAVTAVLRTAADRNMMIVYQPGANDRPLPVRRSSAVRNLHATGISQSSILIRIQHSQKLIRVRETYITRVRDMDLPFRPAPRAHFDHTRRAAGSVLSRLSGILQYSETFYIARKNSS